MFFPLFPARLLGDRHAPAPHVPGRAHHHHLVAQAPPGPGACEIDVAPGREPHQQEQRRPHQEECDEEGLGARDVGEEERDTDDADRPQAPASTLG